MKRCRINLGFLILLIAIWIPRNAINAEPAIHHHSGGKNHHSVFEDHGVSVKPGLRGVFIYTYEPLSPGADVFVQELDKATYDSFFSSKQYVPSPKGIASSFDFLRLLDDRCDITLKCRPCETPKITTTPKVTTTPRVTTTTPRVTTTTPRVTTTTTPKLRILTTTTPKITTTPRTTPKTTTPGPTYLPPESTVFRGPTYLPVSRKTTTRGPTTPPPTYKPRSFRPATHNFVYTSRSYIYPTHSFSWTPPKSRRTTTYGTTTKAPLYSGEYIFPNGTRSGVISESLRRYYDNLYAKERGLGSDYVDKIYEKEEKEGYYAKFRV